MSKFYVVEKAGVPAVWQSDPEHIADLLRRKSGFNMATPSPTGTRPAALALLRQLFPGHRPLKAQTE